VKLGDLTPLALLPVGSGKWHLVVPLGVVVTVSDGGEVDAAPALGRVWSTTLCPQ
jgi:hypothetical protein